MFPHTGSHLDALGHSVRDGLRIDQLPPERWIRKGVTLDLRQTPELGVINMDGLNRAEADPKRTEIAIKRGDIVVLCTGHHKRTWGSFDYWD
jgi:kynurenine formamidase